MKAVGSRQRSEKAETMAADTRHQQGGFTFRSLDDINLSCLTSKKLNYCIAGSSADDFDATAYDEDLNWTVTYGVRNGEYFYQEVRGKHIPGEASDAEQ